MNQVKVSGLGHGQEVTQKGVVSRGFFPHLLTGDTPSSV